MQPHRAGPNTESVIAKDGRRLLSLQAQRSSIFMIDWNLSAQNLATENNRLFDL